MNVLFFIAMFCAIGVSQGVFMAIYLIFSKQGDKKSNYLMAGLLLAIALRLSKSIYYYLMEESQPFLTALGLSGKLAIGPFLLLYLLSLTNLKSKSSYWHILHFLPSLFVVSLMWIFLPHFIGDMFYVGTWILTVYLGVSWWIFYKNNPDGFRIHHQWVYYVLIGFSVIWVTFIIQYFSKDINSYIFGTAVACMVLYSLFMVALLSPELLQIKLSLSSNKNKSIDDDAKKAILEKLKYSFEEEKIYRDASLNLNKLSTVIQKPSYLISKTINSHFGMSFREFVNTYRIAEVKEKLCEKTADFSKVEALAYDVGFNSPSAFYAAFKKETSLSPQEYRKIKLSGQTSY